MAFPRFTLGDGVPAPARPGIYCVGSWHGREIVLAPDGDGSTRWAQLADDYSLVSLDPAETKAAQRAWLHALRKQPVKLRWSAVTASTGFPQRTIERWEKGEALPYYRAVRLAQWQHDRFIDRIRGILPEAADALLLPPHDDRHLHRAALALILELEQEEMELALQMVLHPDFQIRTLSPRQAEEAIREVIVKQRKEREQWEKASRQLRSTWRSKLNKTALKKQSPDAEVKVTSWTAEKPNGDWRAAEEFVEPELISATAPAGLRWQHLAARHGSPIHIVPTGKDPDTGRAIVDERLIWTAELALAQHGTGEPWITRSSRRKKPTTTTPRH